MRKPQRLWDVDIQLGSQGEDASPADYRCLSVSTNIMGNDA